MGAGARVALHAPPEQAELAFVGLFGVLAVAGLWTGQPIIAGAPRTALFWLGIGAIAAAQAWTRQEGLARAAVCG